MRVLFLLVMLYGAVLLSAAYCSSEENTITVGIGEEYNDNVNERPNAKSDFITKPYAKGAMKYEGGRILLDGYIDASYNLYAQGNRADEFKGTALLHTKAALVRDSVFAEASGNIQQVFKSIALGQSNSVDSTNNQVNQGTINGQLYATPRLNERTSLKTGYDFTAYVYGWGPWQNNTTQNGNSSVNKTIHTVFANAAYELTPLWQLFLEANASRQDTIRGGYDKVYANTGFRYQFSEEGVLQVKAGPQYAWFDNGTSTLTPYVDAFAEQKFGRLALRGYATSNYAENPASKFAALKQTAGFRGTWTGERASLTANAMYTVTSGEETIRSNQLSLSTRLSYALTERLTASVGAQCESNVTSRYNQVRWYADGGLTYELGKDFSLQGYYNWKLSDSNSHAYNYNVNIIGIRLMKTF